MSIFERTDRDPYKPYWVRIDGVDHGPLSFNEPKEWFSPEVDVVVDTVQGRVLCRSSDRQLSEVGGITQDDVNWLVELTRVPGEPLGPVLFGRRTGSLPLSRQSYVRKASRIRKKLQRVTGPAQELIRVSKNSVIRVAYAADPDLSWLLVVSDEDHHQD